MKRVRHVQINFSQHSTYIQIVFCSKVSIYTQNSIQYEHTLTLIQYCFQGQNEVDPLLSLISPCVLVLSGILSAFPLRMSTLSVCWWKSPGIYLIGNIQLVVYYQCHILIDWATTRPTTAVVAKSAGFENQNNGGWTVFLLAKVVLFRYFGPTSWILLKQ